MITVLFFASLREALETDSLQLDAQDIGQVIEVREKLASRGENWRILSSNQILGSVNQEIAADHTPVKDGDEVAFFPPVTGG